MRLSWLVQNTLRCQSRVYATRDGAHAEYGLSASPSDPASQSPSVGNISTSFCEDYGHNPYASPCCKARSQLKGCETHCRGALLFLQWKNPLVDCVNDPHESLFSLATCALSLDALCIGCPSHLPLVFAFSGISTSQNNDFVRSVSSRSTTSVCITLMTIIASLITSINTGKDESNDDKDAYDDEDFVVPSCH